MQYPLNQLGYVLALKLILCLYTLVFDSHTYALFEGNSFLKVSRVCINLNAGNSRAGYEHRFYSCPYDILCSNPVEIYAGSKDKENPISKRLEYARVKNTIAAKPPSFDDS